jgi:short-subunit dehydrogenase
MVSFVGKKILVVGANGVFGAEFCNQLMARGASVLGTARSAESSVRLRADLEQRLLLDLGSSESIQQLAGYLGSLDGIVIASGLVAFGTLETTPHSIVDSLMQVNTLGPIELISALLPKLRSGNEPFVVTISGVISEQPMSGLSAYSASKTALAGFATAAAKELRKDGIVVLDARPGHSESGLASRAIFGTAPNFGVGKEVPEVVGRILDGLASGERDLPSSAF